MKKNKQIAKQNTFTEFLLYTAPSGKVKVEILLRDENLWLTQKRMADLFGVGIPAINKHLKSVFETGELQENSVVSILETTAADGKKYPTKFLLDAFLQFNEREVLRDSGRISHEVAAALAEGEYEKYRSNQVRILESDFDREVKKLLDSKKKKP